jgi:acyl-coenzyme A synthetase/AMP-(fatty) acid ligase
MTRSLWHSLSGEQLSERFLRDTTSSVSLSRLIGGCSLDHNPTRLHGRSVLLATRTQFASALALIALDGIARRIVLYPAGMPASHLPSVIAAASADTIVTDAPLPSGVSSDLDLVTCGSTLTQDRREIGGLATEWILLTSGTTGEPKLTMHTLATMAGAIPCSAERANRPVWSSFYDIRRYGGLQIFLRALLTGGSMVFSSAEELPGEFLARATAAGVTHISGTPSHWRRALMSPMARQFNPRYVRLSGEIVDQGILDSLHAAYPRATIVHAFASTEAGVGFEVYDGLAGFPAEFIGKNGEVELKVEDGSLRIRSPRTALRYLSDEKFAIDDGFVNTGDLVELQDGRYYFVGRRDGMINVGGAKVHPEEVEAVLNRHPRVRVALAKARRNRFTGSVVIADVVLNAAAAHDEGEATALTHELLAMCRDALADYKVPAAIHFVPSLEITPSGKLARLNG